MIASKNKILLLITTFFMSNYIYAAAHLPKLFLFLGGNSQFNLQQQKILTNPFVCGAQIIYSWKELEPQKNVYDFSRIKKDVHFLKSINKKLFIQLQDRSFKPDVYNVPDYIRNEAIYHGGQARQYDFPGEGKAITTGWVARVWDPAVRARFQLLMMKLADQFDGEIAGINLPETAVDFDPKNFPKDFTNEKYFAAVLENIAILRKAFRKSIVIQYINFFPGEWNDDHDYMSRLFSFAAANQIGLGGPDVVPYKMSHMKNSYIFFQRYKNQLQDIGMAIQEPDYTYKKLNSNDHYQFEDFYSFSQDYLGASILFWNIEEPFFSHQLLPHLNAKYFRQE